MLKLKFIQTGCTRKVFLIGRYAVKIPNWERWDLFLNGLLGNMQEAMLSTLKDKRLCPVIFSLPGGWLNIMPRAKVLTNDEFLKVSSLFLTAGEIKIPMEWKSDSLGIFEGKVVAIDYGS